MNRHPVALILLLVVSLIGAPVLSSAAVAYESDAAGDHHSMMMAAKSGMTNDCDQHSDSEAPVMSHSDCDKKCCSNCAPVFSFFAVPTLSVVHRSHDTVPGQVDPHEGYKPDTRDRPPRFTS